MVLLLLPLATALATTPVTPDPACRDTDTCADAIEVALAAAVDGTDVVIDLTGHWPVSRPVDLHCPARCRILAGTIEAAPGEGEPPLPYVVDLVLPSGSEVHGILRVQGRHTGWHQHRTAVDGVHLTDAGGAVLDGLDVRWVRRWAARNPPGSNIIGLQVGHVRAAFCGTPGGISTPWYTRLTSTATAIERHGYPRSTHQRATVSVDQIPADVQVGDRAWVGLSLVEVVDLDREVGTLSVYPWPGALEGEGDWLVDFVIGGGVQLTGGNTTGVTIDALVAGYVGTGLHVASLYGAHVRAPVIEVAGVGVEIGGRQAATWGLSLTGLHPELTGIEVLQSGRAVQRCSITSPVVDLTADRYRVERPTLTDGSSWDAPAWVRRCEQIPEVP